MMPALSSARVALSCPRRDADGITPNASRSPDGSRCGRTEDQGEAGFKNERRTRRRRRALCTVAVIVAYAVVSLPCCMGFVAPAATLSSRVSGEVCLRASDQLAGAAGVRTRGARLRPTRIDALRMVRPRRPGHLVTMPSLSISSMPLLLLVKHDMCRGRTAGVGHHITRSLVQYR